MKCFFFLVCIAAVGSCRQIQTIHPQRKELVEAVYASGKILSGQEYYAVALAGGAIMKKLVQEGAIVKKGQVLYVIDSDVPAARAAAASSAYQHVQNNLSAGSRILNDLQFALHSAQATCKNDSLQYSRLKNLFDRGIGMQSTVDNAHTNYQVSRNAEKAAREKYQATVADLNVQLQQAKSSLAAAQADVQNTYIRSEINGTVYQLLKESGEAVRPNDAVALIGSTDRRIIRLAVDQQDIRKVKRGQEVLLKTDVTGNTIYKAVVDCIYPAMNETDQTFRVDAVFTGTETPPYIHSSVEANIIVQKRKAALIIPRTALLANDSVQLKEGRRIKTTAVQTGISGPDAVEVVSGLNESSEVVVPSQQ